MSKVLIIGAGPAGISCAYELIKSGHEVEIYEGSNFVGGMSRSFELWGQTVDLGPHRFFSKNKRINAFFKEIIQEDFTLVNRLTRIHYKDSFFHYPLQFFNVLRNLSFITIFQILKDYFIQRLRPSQELNSFEDWIVDRFGKKLFEIFFKNYSEKLWGIPCDKIDAKWAAQRIKKLSLIEAIWNSIKGNSKKHETLIHQFPYPNEGTGIIYERAADYVCENGGEIHFNQRVKRVLVEAGKACGIELENGTIHKSDYVVSTMPLTNLVEGIDSVPKEIKGISKQLYFRNTILVYLEIDAQNLFEDNWIYIHSSEVQHGRITNFRNWSKSLCKDKKETILCLEYWAFDTDEIWTQDDEKIALLAKKEIRQLGLVNSKTAIKNSKTIRIPKCYPVYETGYQEHLSKVENYLDTIENLLPIGRYGSFKYNNQDHSILMGILAAERIFKGSDVDLWALNTDTEYQEEGRIKDVLI